MGAAASLSGYDSGHTNYITNVTAFSSAAQRIAEEMTENNGEMSYEKALEILRTYENVYAKVTKHFPGKYTISHQCF